MGAGPKRPNNGYSSYPDKDHVLYGEAPYPVLSWPDLREVYPVLEARGMSARNIAQRLHLSNRTIVRYRAKARKKKETRQR